MKRVLFTTLLLVAITGCDPKYPPPEGYVESCYGGDFGKNLAGSTPSLIITMEVEVEHWPKLKSHLQTIAEKEQVDFFYDDRNYGGLKMFNASLCSPNGLFMNADKRIWASNEQTGVPEIPLMISIYLYRENSRWGSFVSKVKAEMEEHWGQYFVEFGGEASLQLSH